MDRDSAVGIATRCGLDGPGVEPWWGKIFRTCPDRPWAPPNLLYNGKHVPLPGVKRPGCGIHHPPYLAPRLKSGAVSLLPFWVFMASSRANFTGTSCTSRGYVNIILRYVISVIAMNPLACHSQFPVLKSHELSAVYFYTVAFQ